jgi:hypothetical protein
VVPDLSRPKLRVNGFDSIEHRYTGVGAELTQNRMNADQNYSTFSL